MAELGKSCPACGKVANIMLLFEVAPGRRVCGECFDKVREHDKSETPSGGA